jgi:hypothetical protein
LYLKRPKTALFKLIFYHLYKMYRNRKVVEYELHLYGTPTCLAEGAWLKGPGRTPHYNYIMYMVKEELPQLNMITRQVTAESPERIGPAMIH